MLLKDPKLARLGLNFSNTFALPNHLMSRSTLGFGCLLHVYELLSCTTHAQHPRGVNKTLSFITIRNKIHDDFPGRTHHDRHEKEMLIIRISTEKPISLWFHNATCIRRNAKSKDNKR